MGLSDIITEPVPCRTMVLFFVIDTSGSMEGEKIAEVNNAIQSVIPEVQKISEDSADANIKVAVLDFSSGVEWRTLEPVDVKTFQWDFLQAGGVTDLGTACQELAAKLSRKAFMKDATGSFAPVIILLSDGEPTDDYKRGLDVLRQNNWYKCAIKIALAIGNDANQEVLAEFTGNKELVLTAHNPTQLRKMIRCVTVTSSTIGSQSSSVADPNQPIDNSQNFINNPEIQELINAPEEEDEW
ncbi:MAG: VWA domain-containing protein [Planctomycetia bacterium]|nr:VWA domain-containing protein [Planctomycetia bacterium]